jgi:hypothetical protein
MVYQPLHLCLAEANTDVRELWEWLRQTATPERLVELEALRPSKNIDVYSIPTKHPAEITLLRLTASGAYVGQLSSKVIYAQHSIDFTKIRQMLPYIRSSVPSIYADYLDTAGLDTPDTLYFVDPPYLGTSANYMDKAKKRDMTTTFDAVRFTEFVGALRCPVLLTYGSDAPETFPDFEWKVSCVRKVPILRGGGTRERTEMYATLNWPDLDTSTKTQP